MAGMARIMSFHRPHIALPQESCAAFLCEIAIRNPDRTALVFEGSTITYGALARQIDEAKARLTGLGLGPGNRIGIALPTGPDYVVQAIAALDVGAVVVPLYDSAPAAEMRAKCLAAQVDAMIVEPTAVDRRRGELAPLSVPPQLLSSDERPAGTLPQKMPAPKPDDLAFLPFSSGTTGEPKLILLSHRNVLASRLLFAQATALRATSVLVHFLPLSHVYGWMALTAALGVGAQVVLQARYHFEEVVADIERFRATSVFAVSQTIIDLERADSRAAKKLESLQWVNTGSAPLAPAIMRNVAERYGFAVTTGYGLTEAAPVTHSAVERPELIDVEAVGYAAADTVLRLVDPVDPERPMPAGEPGELIVSGPQVSTGYRHADGRLDRSSWLSDGSFRTGDLVECDSLGRYRIVGRLKNIIKYKGYSVAPAELEALLGSHPGILDCVVVGRADPEAGEVPTAFVVPRQKAHLTSDQVIAYVRERVAPQRRVRDVVFVDQIPRSSAGKVLTRELLERL